jgi:uncharacterized peroxidase-related enzyme
MALIPYPDLADLDDEVSRAVADFEQAHGRPSLLRRMLAWFPPALVAADHMYKPCFEQGHLSREFKEWLFVVSSHERGCSYCAGGHSRFLVKELGFARSDVERLRDGELVEQLNDAELALVAFMRKLCQEPYKTVDADIQNLRVNGWSDPEIVEALTINMISAFTNTMAMALHLEDDVEDPDYF